MKFTLFISVTILVLLSSCKKEKGISSNVAKEDTLRTNIKYPKSAGHRKLLEGIWAENEESNALFEIKGDSLYYFEDPNPVFYEVVDDSFKIYIEGKSFASKILKLSSDSLVRIEYEKVVRLYKR